jgi:hypothetical protein
MPYLGECPKSGQGKFDAWINRRVLQELRWFWDMSDDDIFEAVKRECKGCGRDKTELEYDIRHAIQTGRVYLAKAWDSEPVHLDSAPRACTETLATSKPKLVESIRDELLAKSDFKGWPTPGMSPLGALKRLFGDGLVCIGEQKWKFSTGRLSEHVFQMNERWLRHYQFIVPNPMSRRLGRTKAGKWSSKSLDNTGERVFFIVEFDFDQDRQEDQAKLIWALRKQQRLVMVVFSGRRSLHSWFDVRGMTEESIEDFCDLAVSVGADKAMKDKSQFTRIPGGVNKQTHKEQKLLYFNFDS